MVEQRRLREALEYVDVSLDRGESTVAHELRGSVLLALGRTADAQPALERAIELNPNNVNAMYNLAGALAMAGSREDARLTIERLLAIRPDHEGARQLGRSLGMDI
jgi:tetratricopeptide (TPR) repeat protein